MADALTFSNVVAALMDTAHDPGLWPGALGRVAEFCGCDRAFLINRDAIAAVVWSAGGAPPVHELPRALNLPPRGQPVQVAIGSWHVLACQVASGGSGDRVLGLCSSEPPAAAAEDRLALLMPHVGTAVAIRHRLARQETRNTTAVMALDSLSTPLVIVDDQCGIIHANLPAKQLIAAGAIIKAENGRLAAGSSDATSRLRLAVSQLALDGASGDSSNIGYLAAQGPVLLTVRHLGREAAAPGAVVFIAAGDERKVAAARSMAELFGLTAVESRVLAASLEGLLPAGIAMSLGVATSTVKTHLNRIYRKTGATNQSELLALRNQLILP